MGLDDKLGKEFKAIAKLIDGRSAYNSLLNEIKEYFNPYGGDFNGITSVDGGDDIQAHCDAVYSAII